MESYEYTYCDLCNSNLYKSFMQRTDRFSKKPFLFCICSNCGLIYLNPRPTQSEIVNYYPSNYECFETKSSETSLVKKFNFHQALTRQLKLIQKYTNPPGMLLDIGCGTGNFMRFARDYGWNVKGIEINSNAANVAIEQYKLDVVTGSLDTYELSAESFDVITFWDVIEHLPSPKNTLKQVHPALTSNGIIVFSIPNLDSFDRYLFRSAWIGWDAPRHLNLYSHKNLARLLKETGYEIVDRKCILGGRGTFFLSLDEFTKRHYKFNIINKLRLIISIPLFPYVQLSYLLRRGPIITYVIRKTR